MKIIRKEILIDAPPAKVWQHVTDPAKIAGWLMPNDFEARLGKRFQMDCGKEGKISCKVLELVPEQKLVYSWAMEDLKVLTTVTITLNAEKGGRTRLVLVHSGWDKLPPQEQDPAAAPFDRGWDERLKILQDRISSAP